MQDIFIEQKYLKPIPLMADYLMKQKKIPLCNFFFKSLHKQRLLILLSCELSVAINEGIVN